MAPLEQAANSVIRERCRSTAGIVPRSSRTPHSFPDGQHWRSITRPPLASRRIALVGGGGQKPGTVELVAGSDRAMVGKADGDPFDLAVRLEPGVAATTPATEHKHHFTGLART